MRCCALLLSSDIKLPPFLPADVGDAPVAASASAASLALAEDRVLSALPLALAIEVFLLALAALPSPLLPHAAHAMVCSSGNGTGKVTIDYLVDAGHMTQRQAGLFGSVMASFAAVAHGLQSAAASSLATLLAIASFHVRCDDSLALVDALPVAKRISAFAHVANEGSKKLQQESAFIRMMLGLPSR